MASTFLTLFEVDVDEGSGMREAVIFERRYSVSAGLPSSAVGERQQTPCGDDNQKGKGKGKGKAKAEAKQRQSEGGCGLYFGFCVEERGSRAGAA